MPTAPRPARTHAMRLEWTRAPIRRPATAFPSHSHRIPTAAPTIPISEETPMYSSGQRRKAAMVLALAASAGGAQAQSNVTGYGIIDAALAHMDNADSAGHGVTRVP